LLPAKMFPEFKESQRVTVASTKELDTSHQQLREKSEELIMLMKNSEILQSALGVEKARTRSQSLNVRPGGAGYLDIKRRYFTALHLRSDNNAANSGLSVLPPDEWKTDDDIDMYTTELSMELPSALDLEQSVTNAVHAIVELRKDKKRAKEELDRILKTRAGFEAEMANLRLMRSERRSTSSANPPHLPARAGRYSHSTDPRRTRNRFGVIVAGV